MFWEISSIGIEFSESLKRMTPNIVPSTFLWHRQCNTDHKTFSFLFLCLATVSRLPAFFGFYLKSNFIMRNARNRGFKHCGDTEVSGVLVRGFREVGEIVVRIVDEHRVIIHRSDLVELFGLITCVCIWLDPVAKLRDACAELRVSCAFRTGKYGITVDWGMSKWMSRNSRDGWKMNETGKATWRGMTHVQRSFLAPLSHACVWHASRMCEVCAQCMYNRKMCVQQVSVCSHTVVHTAVATACVRNSKTLSRKFCQGKNNIHHFMNILTKNSSIRRLG